MDNKINKYKYKTFLLGAFVLSLFLLSATAISFKTIQEKKQENSIDLKISDNNYERVNNNLRKSGFKSEEINAILGNFSSNNTSNKKIENLRNQFGWW